MGWGPKLRRTELTRRRQRAAGRPLGGVGVSANLGEGGRVSPWERDWEEEVRLLTKGKEGDGVKGEPEVSRRVCLEAAAAENKWDRGKQGGRQMVCVRMHTHTCTHT